MTTRNSIQFRISRILAAAAFAAALALPVTPALAQTYNPADVATIQAIAGKSGVDQIKAWANLNNPSQWNGPNNQEVIWDSGRADKLRMNGSELAGTISVGDLTGLTELRLGTNYGLTGLTGLENLTRLAVLDLYNTGVTSLDLSHNTGLKSLDLFNSKITALDLGKNPLLENLDVSNTALTSLNLSRHSNLYNVDIANTGISHLDVSQSPGLKELYVYGSKLASLDITKNTQLYSLHFDFTDIREIDLSRNTLLGDLDASGTRLENLDLSANTKLTRLSVYDTPLETLNLAANTKLQFLDIAGTKISALNLNANTKLSVLDISNTKITDLDLAANPLLNSLTVTGLKELTLRTAGELDEFFTDQEQNIYGVGFQGTRSLTWTGNIGFRNWRDTNLAGELYSAYNPSGGPDAVFLGSTFTLGDLKQASFNAGQAYRADELSQNLADEITAAGDLARTGQSVALDGFNQVSNDDGFIYDSAASTLTFLNNNTIYRLELKIIDELTDDEIHSVYYNDFFVVGQLPVNVIGGGQFASPNAARLAPVLSQALAQRVGGLLERAAFDVATASPGEAASLAGQLTSETVSSGVQAGQNQVKSLTGLVMSHLSPPPSSGAAPAAGDGDYGICVPADDWRLNFRLSGARGSLDSTSRYQGYDQTTTAGVLTMDKKVHPNFRVGAAVMIGRTELDWDSYGSTTKGQSVGAALFTRYEDGPFFASLQVNLGRTAIDNERGLPNWALKAKSEYDMTWGGAGLFAGYTFGLSGLELTPRLGLSYLHFSTDGMTESGAGDLNLRTRKQNQDSLEASFDLNLAYPIQTETALITPHLSVGVASELADKSVTTRTSFVSAPQLGYFTSESADLNRTRFLAGAGLAAQFAPNVGLALDYSGSYQSRYQLHEGSLTLNLSW